jgi:hypothetical protein
MYVYEMYAFLRVIENKKVLFVGKRYLERAAGRIPQGLSFPFDVRTRLVEVIGSVWRMWMKLCMQPETNKWKRDWVKESIIGDVKLIPVRIARMA